MRGGRRRRRDPVVRLCCGNERGYRIDGVDGEWRGEEESVLRARAEVAGVKIRGPVWSGAQQVRDGERKDVLMRRGERQMAA